MSKSVRDKLNEGYYENKEAYPKMENFNKCGECDHKLGKEDLFCSQCGTKKDTSPKEAYDTQMKKYRAGDNERYNNFREDALEEVGLKGHETESRAWSKAWSDGHSSGMSDVLCQLEELAEVILG